MHETEAEARQKTEQMLNVYADFVQRFLAMTAVCLVACIVPALRALRVQPTEALRAG